HSLRRVPTAKRRRCAARHAERRHEKTPWLTTAVLREIYHPLTCVLRAESWCFAARCSVRPRCGATSFHARPRDTNHILRGVSTAELLLFAAVCPIRGNRVATLMLTMVAFHG
ncbi:unnamed protein product, partial [Ectocarpus sp. 12 AP-2014]